MIAGMLPWPEAPRALQEVRERPGRTGLSEGRPGIGGGALRGRPLLLHHDLVTGERNQLGSPTYWSEGFWPRRSVKDLALERAQPARFADVVVDGPWPGIRRPSSA